MNIPPYLPLHPRVTSQILLSLAPMAPVPSLELGSAGNSQQSPPSTLQGLARLWQLPACSAVPRTWWWVTAPAQELCCLVSWPGLRSERAPNHGCAAGTQLLPWMNERSQWGRLYSAPETRSMSHGMREPHTGLVLLLT